MPVTSVMVEDQPLLIEVEDRHVPIPQVPEGEFQDAGSTIRRATDLGEFIQQACVQLYGAVKQAADTVKPDQVELTFGVKLGGEAGIPFVAKGTAEANVAITLTWNPSSKPQAKGGNDSGV